MKKISAMILIVIILVDLTSCHSRIYLSNKQDYETYQDIKHVYAIDLITNNDSTIVFSSRFPGRLFNGEVVGPRHVTLHNFMPESIIYNKGTLNIAYVLKNDTSYKIAYWNDTTLVCLASDTIRIPFTEIKQMHIKKVAHGKSALLALGITGGTLGVLYLLFYLAVSNMSFDM